MLYYLKKLTHPRKKEITQKEKERMLFEQKAREQFLRLKEKGLGITIMTL